MIPNWPSFEGLNCTINTTENCNLRCKYCYETCKTSRNINLDIAYKFIDLIVGAIDRGEDFLGIQGTDEEWIYQGIIWDFIGGDSLIDPDLLDKLFTRINTRIALMEHPLKRGWRCSISSNGTLFNNPRVRSFCEKWHKNLCLGISIDGCPEIHDLNRVFPDGKGSMEKIIEWREWYKKWFPVEACITKATCSRSTIPYLFKSLKFMHEELGLCFINQNFIMEDTGCTEEDYQELNHQLGLCTQYVLDHDNEIYWLILDHTRGGVMRKEDFNSSGKCGSGRMPCCAIDGKIYPCFRWLSHTQNGKEGIMQVGDVDHGFNHIENFIKVQKGSIRANCTKEIKCIECEHEPECSYCIGGCYAEYGDFTRTTHICEITKLLCKWSEIYKKEYLKKHPEISENDLPWRG